MAAYRDLSISPDEIDHSSGDAVHQQIANAILRRIDADELLTGDQLPGTRVLAGQLGYTKDTVSHAYRILENDGRLIRRPHRRPQVRGRPLRRVIDSGRYEDELTRARLGKQSRDRTHFVVAHGITWKDYTVDVRYKYQPATEAQAIALHVKMGEPVLRRELTEHVRGVPVQLRRSVLLAADVSGTPVARQARQPWPGGTIAEIFSLGYEVIRVVERAEPRPASPEEVEKLSLPEGHPVLHVSRVFWVSDQGVDRPIEASEIIREAYGNTLQWSTELKG